MGCPGGFTVTLRLSISLASNWPLIRNFATIFWSRCCSWNISYRSIVAKLFSFTEQFVLSLVRHLLQSSGGGKETEETGLLFLLKILLVGFQMGGASPLCALDSQPMITEYAVCLLLFSSSEFRVALLLDQLPPRAIGPRSKFTNLEDECTYWYIRRIFC